MLIKDLLDSYKADLFSLYSANDKVVNEVGEWKLYFSIPVNAPIAIGWLEDDSLFLINNEGVFIYDINVEELVLEDYSSELKPGISDDNLRYYIQDRDVFVDIFGIRGGGGSLITKDEKWSLRLINLSWNVKIPILTDNETGNFYFLELRQLFYEGYMHIGFSKSDSFFAIMGDGGVDIYKRCR